MQRLHIGLHRLWLSGRIGVTATVMTQVTTEGNMQIKRYLVLTGRIRCFDGTQIIGFGKLAEIVGWRITRVSRYWMVVFLNNLRLHFSF